MKKIPFSLMGKVTGSTCNIDCTYCYYLNKKDTDSRQITLSDEVLEAYIRSYIDSQGREVEFVWHGGEPLLAGLAYFEKIIALQNKHNGEGKLIYNSLQTNGVLLNDKWCEFFSNHNFLIGISIDGPESIHDFYRKNRTQKGTLNKALSGLALLKKHRVEFNTLTVVTQHSADKGVLVYDYLKSLGVEHMQFIPAVDRFDGNNSKVIFTDSNDIAYYDWSLKTGQLSEFLIDVFGAWIKQDVGKVYVKQFDSLLASHYGLPAEICFHRESCGNAMVMEKNGDIFSCDHYVEDDYRIGNVLEGDYIKMLSSDAHSEFSDLKGDLSQDCRSCDYLSLCYGDCPRYRYIPLDSGEKMSFFCSDHKAFFKYTKPYMEYMVEQLQNGLPPSEIMNINL
ncbi:anaerobic sulfatase maturase [Vibrio sp. 10N.286.52.C3]|uniref:anaerobic sulfatase maturase n=1 Tax=unclassified Vibrio TaxID=2614977 RepID=UPI003553F518